MKKLFLLLLLPFLALAQNPTSFPYNITLGAGKTLLNEDRLKLDNMASSTGLYSFAGGGITAASSTTFNVGAVNGYIVSSASPITTLPLKVTYPGGTGLTTPHLLTSPATYVLAKSDNTLLLLPSEPTVTEKRNNIFLGVIGHPAGTITGIGNSPDIAMNEMSQTREMFEPTRLINEGVVPYANSTNLTLANTAGKLYGFGIGFIANGNDAPSILNIAAGAPMTTQYRTQGTTTFPNTTVADPLNYDVAGVQTAIPGSSNQATNQRFYLLENGMIRIQYGQTIYATLADAIAAASNESFVVNVNAKKLGILIGILSIEKGCTNLSLTADARFLPVSKFGETVGAAAGIAIGTLQTSYNNSIDPEIITNSILDGFTVRRGSAADTDNVIVGQNGAGTNTFQVDGNGKVTTSANAIINGLNVGKGASSLTNNTAFGLNALNNISTGDKNTIFGANNFPLITTGSYAVGVGQNLYPNLTSASTIYNVAIGGDIADSASPTAVTNMFIGFDIARNITTASNNIAIGYQCSKEMASGTHNISMGSSSLRGQTAGSNNIAIGNNSGRFLADGTTVNTTPGSCIFLGVNTKAFTSATEQNETVIGSNAVGIGTNSVVLGGDAVVRTALKGRIIQGQTGTIVDNGVDAMQTTGSTTQTGQFKSTLATGTAPLSVTSTTLNTNLNADLLDGLNSTAFALKTYNSYVIDMTQSATSDPVANVVFENGLGSITLTRTGVGTYAVNSSGMFIGNKTFITISNNKYFTGTPVFVAGARTSNNVVELTSYLGGTLTDNIFNQCQIEIRVYN